MQHDRPTALPLRAAALSGLALLAACGGEPLDADLRGLSQGFSTSAAAQGAQARPAPDARGVITYQNSQVVVAQQGETARGIATRLGVNAEQLAQFNGLDPDAPLRRDELVALPSRVDGVAAQTQATVSAPGAVDVTTLAGAAIDRAGAVTTTPAAGAAPANNTPFGAAPAEPVRHTVARGETAYTIARLYSVQVADIAAWNGLGGDLAVREGQQLLVPLTGQRPPNAAATAPGAGSPTPTPPSAQTALPASTPASQPAANPATPATATTATPAPAAPSPAPNLGAQQTASSASSRLAMPVSGAIIRAYSPGRNEGIDIGAPAGTEVRAAEAGTVAAITTNTEGIQIVVIRHADGLLTVYTHLDRLTVAKDATVTRGQTIGRVRAGDPSYLHFEVRQGMTSRDPSGFLP